MRQTATRTWFMTPLVAVAVTLPGVLALHFGQTAVLSSTGGDPPCGAADCVLGAGILVTGAGLLAVLLSVIAGVVLGRRDQAEPSRAVRRGLTVGGVCLLGYAVVSVLAWLPY